MVFLSASFVIHPQHNTMALSKESKALLQAQVELWNQTLSFMKSVALAVALDLRIPDTLRHPPRDTLWDWHQPV